MIVIDYRDKRPIYEQVTEKLTHLIACGALEADSRMPSVRSLAVDLSVNPNTIQRAYAQLEQDGYIYTIAGRGNYVAPSSAWQSGRLQIVSEELSKALTNAKTAGMPKPKALELVSLIWDQPEQKSTPYQDTVLMNAKEQGGNP